MLIVQDGNKCLDIENQCVGLRKRPTFSFLPAAQRHGQVVLKWMTGGDGGGVK